MEMRNLPCHEIFDTHADALVPDATHPVFLPSGTCMHASKHALHTLSGLIDKVVASHAEVGRSSPAEVALIYTMHVALRENCP